MTKVINLIGGPGCGKSTTAAGLFYELKKRGYNCEYVTEYAKDKVYEESFKTLEDQIYVFAKQFHKMWRVKGAVDIIITDSPLLLSTCYNKEFSDSEYFDDLVLELFKKFDNLVFFLERDSIEFQQEGRIQNLSESKDIDNKLLGLMSDCGIPFKRINTKEAIPVILSEICESE